MTKETRGPSRPLTDSEEPSAYALCPPPHNLTPSFLLSLPPLLRYQSFTHLTYSKNRVVSAIQWLPHRKGVVAVACTEALSFQVGSPLCVFVRERRRRGGFTVRLEARGLLEKRCVRLRAGEAMECPSLLSLFLSPSCPPPSVSCHRKPHVQSLPPHLPPHLPLSLSLPSPPSGPRGQGRPALPQPHIDMELQRPHPPRVRSGGGERER
jgi:hypothetical protein